MKLSAEVKLMKMKMKSKMNQKFLIKENMEVASRVEVRNSPLASRLPVKHAGG